MTKIKKPKKKIRMRNLNKKGRSWNNRDERREEQEKKLLTLIINLK